MKVREVALDCLSRIMLQKSYSHIDLDHTLKTAPLNEKDKALLTNIVYGTLQHANLLKWEISLHIKNDKTHPKMMILLMMSLYQMRYLDKIPNYAILNEAVNLAKKLDGNWGGRFCNGVLRTLSREKKEPQLQDFKTCEEYYHILYNHPIWVIKMWEKYYGKEITLKILQENEKEAPLTVRLDSLLLTKEKLLENPNFVKTKLCDNAFYYIGKEPLWELKESKNGEICVQDEASQYVSIILNPLDHEKVLDMCAAPGSKTIHMASLMHNTGKILAIDIHPHRVALIDQNIKRHRLTNIVTKCYDATLLANKMRLNYFDKILVDAPCSGLGVIRRKPDILLDITPDQIEELTLIQEKLLENAYVLLKPNGYLVYSTCTISKKENEMQIIKFLSKHKDMKKVYERQLFPFEYNSDGFYIAKLQKIGENNE